jgi:enoyl-CoA hydratase/carnithine racemase
MNFESVILKKEGSIATITLNRPDSLNALNQQLGEDLAQAIEEVSQDDEMRVLVITGAGRAFSSGADFQFDKVKRGEIAPEKAEEEALPGVFQAWRQGKLTHRVSEGTALALQHLGKPTIAMVNGSAIGAGFDLALACDMRIGSPRTKFSVGYTQMAVIPDLGGTWFLPRIVGISKALELIFTSELCSAEEAYRIGLLNKLVPEEKLEDETMALAKKLAQGPPVAYRLAKFSVYKGLEVNLEIALALASASENILVKTEDYKEAVIAFVEKRAPEFKGK